MQDFKNLKVWRKSHAVALAVYTATRNFRKEELFGLTSQMRRAASSVAANISEGCGRGSDLEFARFLQLALGSASELDYHVLLAHDLCYLDDEIYLQLTADVVEVKRMLASLIGRIRRAA